MKNTVIGSLFYTDYTGWPPYELYIV